VDLLDDELVQFWKALQDNEVRYIMVGGFATNLHGFSRTTADLDLWIQDLPENRQRLILALRQIGLPEMRELISTQLIPGWTNIHLPSGFELDLMTYLSGFESGDFDDCYVLASTAEIDGVSIRFLHLIRSKEASGRPKDQIDLLELKRLRDSL